MATSYLDKTGLTHLWSKIKALTNALASSISTLQGNVTTALAQKADKAAIAYAECDTAAGTAAKTVTITGYNYTRMKGGAIKIKFSNANTVDDATLSINSETAQPLYYNGARASSTNSWDAGETVMVYYDGEKYMANNVSGAELKNTVDTASPSSKKGLTEEAIVGVLGEVEQSGGSYVPLQDQIYAISASSSTVTIALYNDGQHSTATVRFVQDTGAEEVLPVRGTSNPSRAKMTLYRSVDNTSSYEAVATTGDTAVLNSGSDFYQTEASDIPVTYYYYIRNVIYSTAKNTSTLTVTYVRPIFYGALRTTDDEDQPIVYTIDDLIGLNGHDKVLTQYPSATTAAKRTYAIPFDTKARKVYMVVPKTKVSTITPSTVYWQSVISSNRMPFSRITALENNDYYVYVSDQEYTVTEGTEGNRNIIFN